jgi:hypothetical protein
MFGWVSMEEVLRHVGQKKLSALTIEAGEALIVQADEQSPSLFYPPFFLGTGVKVTLDGVLLEADKFVYTIAGHSSRVQDKLEIPAARTDSVVMVSVLGGIGLGPLGASLDCSQDTVRAKLTRAGWKAPEKDATDAPAILVSWVWDLAAYNLVSDLRRAPLADAYKDVIARGAAVEKDLEDLVDGRLNLEGLLPKIDTTAATENYFGKFVGERRFFDGKLGLT